MKGKILLLFLFLAFFCATCPAQDTLRFKNGKNVSCKIIEQTVTYVKYKLTDTTNQVLYTVLQNTIVHEDLHWAKKLKGSLRRKAIYANDSILFNAGVSAVLISCKPMIYGRYSLSQRLSVMLSAGYIFHSYTEQNWAMSFVEQLGVNRFHGPDAQLGLSYSKYVRPSRPHLSGSLNFFYDFRYKFVPTHTWYDDSPSGTHYYTEVRRAQIYSHNLIFTTSWERSLKSNTFLGWYIGGGPQYEKIVAHLISSRLGYNPEINYQNEIKTQYKFDLAIRLGVCLSFNAISIKNNKR